MDLNTKRTWAEISLENIVHNMRAVRAALPAGTRFLGVVKADAYGHGAVAVSRALEANGADYLAVSCLDEALELRRAGVGLPILILGHTPVEYVPALLENDLTQTVTNRAKALEYDAAAGAQAGHRHGAPRLSLRRGALRARRPQHRGRLPLPESGAGGHFHPLRHE